MNKYDYYNAVKSDVESYIKEHVDGYIDDNFRQKLEDDMFVSDSVTGNASGSYTFNTWQAEENLCHNHDLISDAVEAFGLDSADFSKGAEYWDVTIRCYLLNQVVRDVVSEWNETHPEETEEEE